MIPELVKEPKDLTFGDSPKQRNLSNTPETQSAPRLKSILKKPPSRDGTTADEISGQNLESVPKDDLKPEIVEYNLKPGGKSEIVFETAQSESVVQTEEKNNTEINNQAIHHEINVVSTGKYYLYLSC